MSVLSAQSIRSLCIKNRVDSWYRVYRSNHQGVVSVENPLIYPFVERGVQNGRSYGLSACTYDCRSAGDILLPVGQGRLAVTMERFHIPNIICGSVLDKSTHARVFVSAFNTHLDPGWYGYLTVELVNLGTEVAEWKSGDPLCQIKFEWLDEETDSPYRGKYQDQPMEPVSAQREE